MQELVGFKRSGVDYCNCEKFCLSVANKIKGGKYVWRGTLIGTLDGEAHHQQILKVLTSRFSRVNVILSRSRSVLPTSIAIIIHIG